jgi:hypothetical protein
VPQVQRSVQSVYECVDEAIRAAFDAEHRRLGR